MSVPHSAMGHTTPYSCLQVPAEKGQPHCVSRSILELEAMCYLSVFRHLYPDQISPTGLPTGFNHISTRLHCLQWIPYTPIWYTPWAHHLAARLPWLLTPQGKIILVCCRHPWSCHPWSTLKWRAGSCENELCHHRQPGTHPAHASTTAATTKPATVPEAAKPIRSTDDLISKFPDQFKGIGRFPGEYKIWLC